MQNGFHLASRVLMHVLYACVCIYSLGKNFG